MPRGHHDSDRGSERLTTPSGDKTTRASRVISLRLTHAHLDALEAMCERAGVDRSTLIRSILDEAIRADDARHRDWRTQLHQAYLSARDALDVWSEVVDIADVLSAASAPSDASQRLIDATREGWAHLFRGDGPLFFEGSSRSQVKMSAPPSGRDLVRRQVVARLREWCEDEASIKGAARSLRLDVKRLRLILRGDTDPTGEDRQLIERGARIPAADWPD